MAVMQTDLAWPSGVKILYVCVGGLIREDHCVRALDRLDEDTVTKKR
jgi:hypothetical protein